MKFCVYIKLDGKELFETYNIIVVLRIIGTDLDAC